MEKFSGRSFLRHHDLSLDQTLLLHLGQLGVELTLVDVPEMPEPVNEVLSDPVSMTRVLGQQAEQYVTQGQGNLLAGEARSPVYIWMYITYNVAYY